MKQVPFIYRHPLIYTAIMRMLHRSAFDARYRLVAAEVPEGASVTEACCGDCELYRRSLQGKVSRYTGLEFSPAFVRAAQGHGIDCRETDLRTAEIPEADVVIMQAALYQFHPDAAGMIRRLLQAAGRRVIIAEPVKNLSESGSGLLRAISRKLTATDGSHHRFTTDTFLALVQTFPEFVRSTLTPDGREMITVFDKPSP